MIKHALIRPICNDNEMFIADINKLAVIRVNIEKGTKICQNLN